MRLCDQPHFTDEENEAENGSGICPWSTKLVRTKGAWMYWFAKAAVMKYPRLGGLNNRNALFHQIGGWKSNIIYWFLRKAVWEGSAAGLGEAWKALACR